MNIPVTLPARREQPLFETPAAVTILHSEDIRRSGATSVPEALRMVPGLLVARVDTNKWAIGCRLANDLLFQSLLVQVDGRLVYNTAFSGTLWDTQDIPLADVERIEVVRGPGGSLWGSNAAEGIINIVTKHARDTQNGLLVMGSGREERTLGYVRQGGKLNGNTYYRVYAQHNQRGPAVAPSGADSDDPFQIERGGIRIDWKAGERDQFLVIAELRKSAGRLTRVVPTLTAPFRQTSSSDDIDNGGHVIFRWQRRRAGGSEASFQLFYDRVRRQSFALDDEANTYDLDFQSQEPVAKDDSLVWGAGFRGTSDNLVSPTGSAVSFNPSRRQFDVVSAFIERQFSLMRGRWLLSVGAKFERNDFSGAEIQPNARFRFAPGAREVLWGAVTRSVRVPSRFDQDGRSDVRSFAPGTFGPFTPAVLQSVLGSRNFGVEVTRSHELGYRRRVGENLSFDLALFYNLHQAHDSFEPGAAVPELVPVPPHLLLPLNRMNLLKGHIYGAELTGDWRVSDRWRLTGTYSSRRQRARLPPASLDQDAVGRAGGRIPRHQAHLRSYLDLTRRLEWDVLTYWVDALPFLGVPSYVRADSRVGWRPRRDIEISVIGQNLFRNRHLEFSEEEKGYDRVEVERSVYGKVTLSF